jgi:hypothetical protein
MRGSVASEMLKRFREGRSSSRGETFTILAQLRPTVYIREDNFVLAVPELEGKRGSGGSFQQKQDITSVRLRRRSFDETAKAGVSLHHSFTPRTAVQTPSPRGLLSGHRGW